MRHDHTPKNGESAVVLLPAALIWFPFNAISKSIAKNNNQQHACETMILEGCEKAAHMGNNYT